MGGEFLQAFGLAAEGREVNRRLPRLVFRHQIGALIEQGFRQIVRIDVSGKTKIMQGRVAIAVTRVTLSRRR